MQPLIRAASGALSAYGFLGPVADSTLPSWDRGAFAAAATLGRELELASEEDGRIIPTEFIDIVEWRGAATSFFAWIAWRNDGAAVPARLIPASRQPGHHAQEF